MAIIDDRTTNLNFPLPNIGNKLVDDVARLRTAFSDVDTAVALKADAIATYSKAQVDAAIAGATPSFSTLTGKPTTVAGFGITDVMTSTATQTALDLKANQATTYTKTETDTRIQDVVGVAPLALDTLAEIATQLASDESAAAALVTTVATKVDKVAGKGLSTEDFTTAEKTKLAAVTGTNTGDQVIPTTLPASDVSGWAKAATKPTYTATEVGLANVNNTTDLLKPISTATQTALDLKANQATTYTKTETDTRIQAVVGVAPLALDTLAEIATQLASDESAAGALTTAVALKAPLASPIFTGTVSGITKAMVGLGSVDNTTDLLKPVSTATTTAIGVETTRAITAEATKVDKVTGKGLSTEDFTTAEKTKLAAVTGTNTGDQVIPTTLPASDVSAWAKAATKPTYTATEVGLGSVNNTTDAAKPVSTATQAALNLKVDSSTLGTMSTQSAAEVAITGGTINGITFSGGTY